MTQVATLPEYAIKPRWTRRWPGRTAAAGLVLLAIAYAALPLWLPTGWIARRLTDRLSMELGRRVRIGRVSVGWRDGVLLEDLTVAAGPRSPERYLTRIGAVRCGFTPMATLFSGRVNQVEMVGPELWLVFNEQGRLINIDDLRQRRGGRLPALNYVIRQAACHVLTPHGARTFKIDSLECELERRTGLLRLFGEAAVTRSGPMPRVGGVGRFALDAKITLQRLKQDEKLDGDVRVEWRDLAVADLPWPLAARLPIEQVDGATTGQLMLAVNPDLGIDYDLFIAFDGVRVLRAELDQPAQVPDADLRCRGHWNPNTDLLLMRAFEYETQAIHVRQSGGPSTAAIVIDPRGETPFELHLAGRIKDWLALGREFPEVDAFARAAGVTFSGSADLAVDFTRGRHEDHLTVSVDGRQSRWLAAGDRGVFLSADVGVPKGLHLEVARNRQTRRFSQPRVSLTVGELSLAAHSQVIVPEPDVVDKWQWLADALPTLESEITLKTARLQDAAGLLPVLATLTEVSDWKGPLALEASITPAGRASEVEVHIQMGPETSLTIGDWFHKLPGEALSATAGLVVPHRSTGKIEGFSLEAGYGPSRVRLDGEGARLEYRSAFLDGSDFTFLEADGQPHRPVGIDASWVAPVHIEHIEGLLSLLPRWREWAGTNGSRDLAGSVKLVSRGSISHRPDDWLMNNELRIVADRLAIRWDDQVNKPAGVRLTAEISPRWHVVGGRREQSWAAAVTRPGGELSGFITFAGTDSGDRGDDFEHAALALDIDDLEDWLALAPALADRLKPYRPRGPVTAHIENLLIDGEQTVSVRADATAAAFVIPGTSPLSKPPGTAAAVALQWCADRADSAAEAQNWELTGGHARLAGVNLDELSGRVLVAGRGPASGPSRSARSPWRRPAARPIVKSAILSARGTVLFDDSLAELHPRLEEWRQSYDLDGSFTWDARLRVKPGTLLLTGRVDAQNMGLALHLGNPVVPEINKPPGTPGSLAFDLSASGSGDADSYRIDINRAALDLDGNSATMSGVLAVDRNVRASPWIGDAALTVDGHLQRPDRALALVPGSVIDEFEGAVEATIAVNGSKGRFMIRPNRLGLDSLAIRAGADPIEVDGEVVFDETKADIGQLRWAWGRSAGVVSGILHLQDGQGPDRMGLCIERLDLKDLSEQFASLPLCVRGVAETAPAGRWRAVQFLIDRLRRSDLNLDGHVGTLAVTGPGNVRVIADAVAQRATVENGELKLQFRGLVDGGYVAGSIETNLKVAEPVFHLAYTADQVQPGPVVDGYLKGSFPGMKATGPLTLIDESYQRLLPEPGDPNFEVGQGQLIIEGGTIEGRAAPLWMTRIFPGLNLARFSFSYMHSWFEKLPDGRTRHQMIFQGRFYNIYMVGYSRRDQRFQYEVGIDFLADFDSQYWAEAGQGRVPLFNKRGKVLEDGTIADELVDYVPRQFILGLLVKNNPVITAYHAVRKRVLGEK